LGFSYTADMKNPFNPACLDVRAFVQSGGVLAGTLQLGQLSRVGEECAPGASERPVPWSARGELRRAEAADPELWLRLDAHACVPMVCQRCLGPVDIDLVVERWFRFVSSEELAAQQDDDSEEDLLVMAGDFNLHSLVEDELVLELPLIPRHLTCPVQPQLQLADREFQGAAPVRDKPFAALAGFKPGKVGQGG